MIYLIISLLFSLVIVVIFKLFPKFNIDTLQALIINYLVALLSGLTMLQQLPTVEFMFHNEWLHLSLIAGISFFVVFNIFAQTAKLVGVALTAVSSKMSVAIPVVLGVVIFNEHINLLKIAGIILAMLSFVLIFKPQHKVKIKKQYLILPILLFFGNGLNDTLQKYAQFYYITTNESILHYLTVTFSLSFISGLLFYIPMSIFNKNFQITVRNIIAGVALGLCNWFAAVFFIKGLQELDVSIFIPIFNASLVSLSAIIGIFIFKEKFSPINIAGIVLSIIAITLIAAG